MRILSQSTQKLSKEAYKNNKSFKNKSCTLWTREWGKKRETVGACHTNEKQVFGSMSSAS